jgi:hypothetical protein
MNQPWYKSQRKYDKRKNLSTLVQDELQVLVQFHHSAYIYTKQEKINWPKTDHCTVGNQTSMTSSSSFQRLNTVMNTSVVSLSYAKTRFPEIKWNPGKAHPQKILHKSVIIWKSFLLSISQNIWKWRTIWNEWLNHKLHCEKKLFWSNQKWNRKKWLLGRK